MHSSQWYVSDTHLYMSITICLIPVDKHLCIAVVHPCTSVQIFALVYNICLVAVYIHLAINLVYLLLIGMHTLYAPRPNVGLNAVEIRN